MRRFKILNLPLSMKIKYIALKIGSENHDSLLGRQGEHKTKFDWVVL